MCISKCDANLIVHDSCRYQAPRWNTFKRPRFTDQEKKCYKCGRWGHIAGNCRGDEESGEEMEPKRKERD